MPLKSIDEEIRISDGLWENYVELRSQMDAYYQYIYEYADKAIFPAKEKGWEQVRYNGASVIVNKALGLLSDAWVHLSIPMPAKSDQKEREKISATEQVAIGSLYAADRSQDTEYIVKKLQDIKAWNSIVRGGTVSVVLLHEKKKGEIIKDIREYDPYECLFQRGRFERRYYEDTQYLKDKYGNDEIRADDDNGGHERTLCHEIWRPGEWAVITKDEKLDSGKTNLDYIPVKICTVGSVPLVYSSQFPNTLKHAFVSALTNNRDLYDKISQVLSILASRAKDSGRIKVIMPMSTGMAGGGTPVAEAEKMGYSDAESVSRTEIITIDVSKGEGNPFLMQPPTDAHLMNYLNVLFGMDVLGTIDPIAFGQSRKSGQSGALAAELRNAALEFLNPFKLCMEESYIFDAEETIRQFVKNDFSKDLFKGWARREEIFREEISPKQVTDKEFFECSLQFDRLRDIAQEAGIAINLKNNGLISTREALDRYNLSDNPDKTIEMMNAELADKDPVNRYRNWAYAALDEGTDESRQRAAHYYMMSEIYKELMMRGEISVLENAVDKNIDNPATAPQVQTRKIASDMSL